MLYAASFLISAIAFSFLALGETEPWARDEIDDEKSHKGLNVKNESMELNSTI
jgi:hypothetical protein